MLEGAVRTFDRAKWTFLLPLLAGLPLASCGQHDGSDSINNTADAASGDGRSIAVRVSGDRSVKIRADGASGAIALVSANIGKMLVTITATQSEDDGNRNVEAVVGPFAVPPLAAARRLMRRTLP